MFENLTDLRGRAFFFFFVTSVMDQICLHWKLANVLMPQKSCAKAKNTLNLSKCMSHLPTHKAHSPPPKPDPSEAETCGTRSQESVSFPLHSNLPFSSIYFKQIIQPSWQAWKKHDLPWAFQKRFPPKYDSLCSDLSLYFYQMFHASS